MFAIPLAYSYLCTFFEDNGMKKVLILSSKPPYPLRDGAAIRTHQSIFLFSRIGYEVDVLYLSETDDEEVVKEGLHGLYNQVVHFKVTKRQSYLKVLKGLATNLLPLQVNYFYSKRARKWIVQNQHQYDIIYCNNIRTAHYARGLKPMKIIDYVDAYSMNYQSARENTKGLWHWIYTIDYPRCNKYEQRILHAFDKCLIISDIDRQYILNHASKPAQISVIENFTPIDDRRIPSNPDSCNLVFIGAMNYEPNVSAVRYFSRTIMPELVKRYPNLHFYIVGKTPTPEVEALADEHTTVTGYVDSTWDYLKIASLVVTPMQSGSGLQNKILQSLAVGACVVTTPKGFEGLVTDEGQPFVAQDSDEMIKIISHLLDNPQERQTYGALSVEYVKRHYDVSVIQQKFKDIITSD